MKLIKPLGTQVRVADNVDKDGQLEIVFSPLGGVSDVNHSLNAFLTLEQVAALHKHLGGVISQTEPAERFKTSVRVTVGGHDGGSLSSWVVSLYEDEISGYMANVYTLFDDEDEPEINYHWLNKDGDVKP